MTLSNIQKNYNPYSVLKTGVSDPSDDLPKKQKIKAISIPSTKHVSEDFNPHVSKKIPHEKKVEHITLPSKNDTAPSEKSSGFSLGSLCGRILSVFLTVMVIFSLFGQAYAQQSNSNSNPNSLIKTDGSHQLMAPPQCNIGPYIPYQKVNFNTHYEWVNSVNTVKEKIQNESDFFLKFVTMSGGVQSYAELPKVAKSDLWYIGMADYPNVKPSAMEHPIMRFVDIYNRQGIAYKYRDANKPDGEVFIGIFYRRYRNEDSHWVGSGAFHFRNTMDIEYDVLTSLFSGQAVTPRHTTRSFVLTCDPASQKSSEYTAYQEP